MIVLILTFLLLFSSIAISDNNDQPTFIENYKTVAVAPPQIAQIFTNPNLSDMKDIDLSSESQIKLFEEFGDNLCRRLAEKSKSKMSFLCYDEIRSRLKDDKNWDLFNNIFSGKNYARSKLARLFAEKLKADGVIASNLLFSYYEQPKGTRHVEVFFEWNLIDLMSGESTAGSNSSCNKELTNTQDEETIKAEYNCFENMNDNLVDYFVKLYGFEKN